MQYNLVMKNIKMPAIPIDAILFAHIFNDPFLAGSYELQGIQFSKTCLFLNQFILTEKNTPEAVKILLHNACSQLVHYENEIQALRRQRVCSITDADALATRMHTAIKELNPREYLLLPGGWLGPNEGHAIIYQCSLTPERDLLFSIYNSGSGLEFHEKKFNPEKDLFNPVFTYRIPKDNIANPNFTAILRQLIAANIPSLHATMLRGIINAEYLYQHIFTQFIHLNGTIISSQLLFEDCYTAGQLSGTCAQRVLHQMLKSKFADLDEYRCFIYRFKRYALNQYMVTFTQSIPTDQAGQIHKAIRHLLRLINSSCKADSRKNLFDEAYKTQELNCLRQYLSRLHTGITHEILPVPQKITFGTPQPFHFGAIEQAANAEIELTGINLPKPMNISGHDTLLADLDRLLAQCDYLYTKKQYQAVFEQLEDCCLSLPLPRALDSPLLPFYSAIKSEPLALTFYKKINALQELYFNSVTKILGESTSLLPRMLLVKMSVFAVVAHMNHHMKLTPTTTGFHQFCAHLFHTISPGSIDTPYLASEDEAKNKRLAHIQQLYSTDQSAVVSQLYYMERGLPCQDINFQILNYYQSLLQPGTELFSLLQKRYETHYSATNLKLHQHIAQHQLKALYYFTEHRQALKEESKDNPQLQVLLERFCVQEEMEKSYAYKKDLYVNKSIKIVFHENRLIPESPFFRNSEPLTLGNISDIKYTLPYSPHRRALQATLLTNPFMSGLSPRSDNIVQLRPGECAEEGLHQARISDRMIDATALEERQLYHLRKVRANQIPLTLDYFRVHLEKLCQHEMQVYCEANLLQPGLLNMQLRMPQQDNFWQQFQTFIHQGLNKFEYNGLLDIHAVFFIRLAYLVTQYAAQHNPIFLPRLQELLQQLNRWIDGTQHESVKTSLHQYRFLIVVRQMQLGINTNINEGLISYFYIQAKENTTERLDIDTQFTIQCAKHYWMRQLHEHQAVFDFPRLLPQILRALSISITDATSVSGSFPTFKIASRLEHMTFNIEQGRIYQDNLSFSAAPSDLRLHPVSIHFGIKETHSCFMSPDNQVLLIKNGDHSLRFLKRRNGYHVQKRWKRLDNTEEWYQLIPFSALQATWLQLAHNIPFSMPGYPQIMTERETLAWVSIDGKEMLLSQYSHPIFCGPVNSALKTNDGSARLIGTTATWIHQLCESFEDKKFIIVTESLSTPQYTVNLPRYSLKFSVSKQDNQLYYFFEGRRYQYQEGHARLGQGIACMHFKENNHELCLLPIQRFINTNQREIDGEYYRLQQDVSGSIPDAIVREIIGEDKPRLWQFSETERYIALPIHHGKPKPQTPSEALYLCYLYLGSNQPEKAWDAIEDCDHHLGGLNGHYDEIRFLNWICNDLPKKIFKQDNRATISTPPFVACKLKALALLADYVADGKAFDFPSAPRGNDTNATYQTHEISATRLFYRDLNHEIYHLVRRLQAMRRDLPIAETKYRFVLNHKETQQLLNFYHLHLPNVPGKPKAIGALGYEWVTLHLKTLRKEYNALLASAQLRALNVYEARRKEDILSFLQHHEGIARVRSELEYHPIDLRLNAVLNYNTLHNESRAITVQETHPLKNPSSQKDISHALSLLSPYLNDNDFILQFRHYFNIAKNGSADEKAQLQYFCQATLIAQRHAPLDEKSNIFRLCNALYRIIGTTAAHPSASISTITTYEALLTHVQALKPTPIMIPQLVDKTESLISAQRVWESLPESTRKRTPSIPATKHPASLALFSETSLTEMLALKQEWLTAYTIYQTGGENSTNPQTAGNAKLKALTTLKKLASTHLTGLQIQKNLQQMTESHLKKLEQQQESLESTILAMAHQALEVNQQWQIDVLAMKCQRLDLSELLTLYFHANIENYATATRLSEAQIAKLHHQSIAFVTHALHRQQLQRILKQLVTVKTASEEEREQEYFQLAEILFADNTVDVDQDPALSLFQYHGDILLRPQQKEVIAHLLEMPKQDTFRESAIKMIMGGGKSKVFLPILAQKKATGENLVIIEVPKQLLRTNFIDLKATSMELFKQKAHLFEFNRNTNCSPNYLEQQFHLLSNLIIDKDYLVTTGDVLQSLELKYLELLADGPKKNQAAHKIWEKQIYWLDQLVLLFRHRGDLIIDEVHQGLLLKNKLNYTLDTAGTVPQHILKYTVDLYQFFQDVTLDSIGLVGQTLYDVVLNNQLLTQLPPMNTGGMQASQASEPNLVRQAMHLLTHALVTHAQSPLYVLMQTYSHVSQFQQAIELYLNNKSEIPECVTYIKNKELLALYKEQVNHLLPMTLKRNYREHYGPSKLDTHHPEVKALAIPYLANNVPNERCRFRSWLETTNFTVQSLMISGLTEALVKLFIDDLLSKARHESRDYEHLDQTPSANLFAFLQTTHKNQWKLSEVIVDNEKQLREIYVQFRDNKLCIFHILQHRILKYVRKDNRILHSDAYNHVDLVRSCQGMSGTPFNHSTFHQRLHFYEKSALGTDEYIIEGFCAKNPRIHAIDFKTSETFLNAVFAPIQACDQVRSIIDISASFKGIDNLEVAQEIAHYIALHADKFSQPKAIRYILFFNEANQLSALPVELKTRALTPIVIGTSDPKLIQDRLGCLPEERFTFYDQAHTFGTDINQYGRSKGLAMITPDTHLSSFLQGITRKRKLISGEQTLDIIVPTALTGKTLPDILQMMSRAEQQQLLQDNYEAARLRMRNLIRASFMQHILAIRGENAAMKKQQLFEVFKHYFIEEDCQEFFTLYGGLDSKEPAYKQLALWEVTLLDDWRRLISQAEPLLNDPSSTLEETERLQEKLHAEVEKACIPGVCEPEQWRRSQEGAEVETQAQAQVDVQVFTEKEIHKETYNPNLSSAMYQAWTSMEPSIHFKSLHEICQTTGATYIPNFNSTIRASCNFYKTYAAQQCFIDPYAKPVHALLFKKEGERLVCTLLTPTECQQLMDRMKQTHQSTIYWITTTQHTTLAGTPPPSIQTNKAYQEIIEQVRYFNGDLKLLLERDAPFTWLEQDCSNKINFFTEYLQPYRETTTSDVQRLAILISRKINIYQEIVSNPTKDLRHENWAAHFPEISLDDIEELRNLAIAFYRATTLWWKVDLTTIPWQREHQLPITLMGYLMPHVLKMNILRELISHIDKNNYSPEDNHLPTLITKAAEHGVQAAIKFLNAPSAHPDYHFLTDLFNEIPQIAEPRYILLGCMAQHKDLDEHGFQQLLVDQTSTPQLFNLMIAHPIFKLANPTHLKILIKKCPDETVRMACLENKQADEVVFRHTLDNKPTKKQFEFIAQHTKEPETLKQIISTCQDEAVCMACLENKQADEVVFRHTLDNKPTKKQFEFIAQHTKEPETLKQIISTCQDEKVRMACLQHKKADETTYESALDQHTTDADLTFIAQQTKNPTLWQRILHLANSENTIIEIAGYPKNTPKLLIQIVRARPSEMTLKVVLNHSALNEEVLEALMDSKALTEDTLAIITKKTRCFKLLLKIDKHPLAKKGELETHPFAVKIIVNDLLKKLQVKTNALIHKGTPGHPNFNPRYQQVGELARSLNTELNSVCLFFFHSKDPITTESLANFKREVQQIVEQAKPAFANHREVWYSLKPILRKLLGILAGITMLPMLGVMLWAKQGYIKTFFVTPTTDAFNKLESFARDLNQLQLIDTPIDVRHVEQNEKSPGRVDPHRLNLTVA
jgi:hypothetical protein